MFNESNCCPMVPPIQNHAPSETTVQDYYAVVNSNNIGVAIKLQDLLFLNEEI